MLNEMILKLTEEYRADPRNKIFINEQILIASATEETGNKITAAQLRKVIAAYLSGDMTDKMESIYDGAVFSCGASARQCFGDDPDEDIDYEIDWLKQDDGSFIAEVRPS